MVKTMMALPIILCLTSACTAPQATATSLYHYFQQPTDIEQYGQALRDAIAKGEQDNNLPPGIYAEYGYVLTLQGRPAQAISYFIAEKQARPESAAFMDLMIKNTGHYISAARY